MIWRIGVGLVLLLLGIAHIFFGIANFGFVEDRDDLNVLTEGVGATIAGLAFLWTAVQFVRRINRWLPLLIAGAIFASTMVISIATGASDPSMLLVSLIAPLAALAGLAQSHRATTPRAESLSRR